RAAPVRGLFAWPPRTPGLHSNLFCPARRGQGLAGGVSHLRLRRSPVRKVLALAAALAFLPGALRAEEGAKQAPKVVLKSPDGELWKTFDAKAMPTNILIDKGGKVVKVVPGCTKDGKNAQLLSAEIARLLQTAEAPVTDAKPKK